MPVIISNILYISTKSLIDSKIVSEDLVFTSLAKNRKGKIKTWNYERFLEIDGIFHKQDKNTRKGNVYVKVESLNDKIINDIRDKICDGCEPFVFAKNNIKEEIKHKTTVSLVHNVEVNPEHVGFFSNTGYYTQTECQQLARFSAWIHLLEGIKAKEAHKLGFDSVNELRDIALSEINIEAEKGLVRFRTKRLNSQQVLYRYITNYRKIGCNAFLLARVSNSNARKIKEVQHAFLMTEISKPTKPLFEDIGITYNQIAAEKGWPKLTVSAIKTHLNKAEYKRVWYFSRNGRDAGNNEYQSLIQRKTPSFPDALLSIDGTALQLYYQDDKGKIKSELYIYYVTDANSSAIVGYSIAFTETSELVIEALKMYIDNHGYLPYQLQYDNSSANVSNVVKGLIENMSKKVSFPCKPYLGRSKYVEALIGHMEQTVLRKFENFKGGSPTTKNINSKANPDLLKSIKKDLPTQYQVIQQIKQGIEDWNKRGERRNQYGEFIGKTKLERYNQPNAKRVKLNYFQKLTLFMITLKKEYTYNKQGIVIKNRHYIVPDQDGVGDFMFQQVYLGQKFRVRMNVSDQSIIHLYQKDKLIGEAIEKEKYASCLADLEKGEMAKIKKYQLKQEQYGQVHSQTELERQKEVLNGYGIAAGTGTNGYSWQDLPKMDYNTQENKQVDEINNIGEESDLIKKLRQIGG